jgi:hypothetical protein
MDTTADRFDRKVTIGPDCWEWIGAKTSSGYGHLSVDGATIKAHRYAWEREHGPIPDGLLVCHTCDNRLCVRLSHLFLGSAHDNTGDMRAKGRDSFSTNKGELHGRAKLTDDQVREIRARAAAGESHRSLARHFDVHHSQIGNIVRRERWAHL